jgi:hypothetical protein
MKSSLIYQKWLLVFTIFGALILVNCKHEDSFTKEPDYIGKGIYISCGGTVVQFLNSDTLGETWTNPFISPNIEFKNCVLVGNLSTSFARADTTFGFNFKFVNNFSKGNFCDIGGLPKTKIEIVDLFNLVE